MGMESILTVWQGSTLCGIVSWIFLSSYLNLTPKIRSLVQPWVTRHVFSETPFILQVQKYQHRWLDALFSVLSCVVSVPFYTAFLPLLFWSGHGRLARQLTLLMAFCDYIGNSIKDVISAPRPSSPPVRRITATKDEVENAMEYGLPSSHTLNTVCLSGYMLHYILSNSPSRSALVEIAAFAAICMFVCLIAFGRVYLGMHSVIDIIGGFALGLTILAFWLKIHDYVDDFVISGHNVTYFCTTLSFLLLFAYPCPEFPTPSFEFHTAFNGVALGIVTGVQQTYHHFHHDSVPKILTPQLPLTVFVVRVIVGIPTILIVKFCSKALAKWILPVVSNTMGIPIRSTTYLDKHQSSGDSQKQVLDVDTGIRFFQYAGLAWSVVDLVPTIFSHLRL